MSEQTFLNGRVTLHAGDCLDVIKTLADASVDSVVTDPPYGLAFMAKHWDSACAKQVAFNPSFWSEVYRVLKPGGHVLAFGGTRTVHRLTCAIEDAGFEIRDMVAWLYGSGFPKSHDVGKQIDRRPGVERHPEFAADLRAAMAAKGFTNTFDVAEKVVGRRTGAVANWQKYQWPEARWWPALRDLLDMDEAKWGSVIAEAERVKTGQRKSGDPVAWYGQAERGDGLVDVTSPTSAGAKQWDGWGTALKPALEPITVGRKPLAGTVAENVLAHGTGALNIAGCRVVSDARPLIQSDRRLAHNTYGPGLGGSKAVGQTDLGRWPANLIHDGSDEVVAAFPESKDGVAGARSGTSEIAAVGLGAYSNAWGGYGGQGSAARFFYNAKADSDDRIGSKHPTVKPVDLMRYLVRLITPPGGTVLDPFAGTGTTGEAAFYEGFRAVLIEREEEYRADIARRMTLAMAGPDERKREIVKAKAKPDSFAGTLFAEAAE